jgi:hypothetical protein
MNIKSAFHLLFVFLFSTLTFGQVTYQGPATGSVSAGLMVSTDNFTRVLSLGEPIQRDIRNIIPPGIDKNIGQLIPPAAPPEANYFEDKNADKSLNKSLTQSGTSQTVLLQDFVGLSMTNSIPPDPHIAVGPNHILATVNSRFAIWDKQGNLLSDIDADTWYASVLTNPGAFDPQIIYDHFDNRWFMLWDSQVDNPPRAHFLISISDDDDPTGIWYNYALPANVMGSDTVDSWGDYPQIGFDDQAIYINSRQFEFGGGKTYDRIRILDKSEYYAATGGPVAWKDIYDISYPGSAVRPDVIHPVIMYSTASEYYFVHAFRGTGNFISLYRLTNPLTTPVLAGVNIPVTSYFQAPDANQLGGGTPLIASNESHIKTAPVYRDGFIWYTHSVRHPTSTTSTSLRYGKINVGTNSVVEEATFGSINHWYLFPHLAIDKDQNIAINYTRTSLTEYAGAFYTTRLASDPPGLSGSKLLKEGAGNYVVTFGGTRNRWGDYQGIYLDPVTEYNIWMFTEYASDNNTWGTWVGEIRLVPFPGVYLYSSHTEFDFENVEVNFQSSTLDFVISNYGENQLTINSIPDSIGPFKRITDLSFPFNLDTYDSLTIEFIFAPTQAGEYEEFFTFSTNDLNFTGISLKGKGFQINPGMVEVLYASTGVSNNGLILTINLATGSGTTIGPSLFSDVNSLAINPKTGIIYGIATSLDETELLRVNSVDGDAYHLNTIPLGNISAICFDTLGTLYSVLRTGQIYSIDLANGDTTFVTSAGVNISGAAFNPLTNELWASALVVIGSNKDRIFKINLSTGDTTIIGNTGLNVVNNDIVFDGEGNLYAATGSATSVNNFISIDKQTGAGTVIGSIGFSNITGLTYLPSVITSVENEKDKVIPDLFSLNQNYPNPFNPSTTIEFSLPVTSDVKLTVYNILGEVVNILVNQQLNSGVHAVNWNSTNISGTRLGSGVYFLELKAKGDDGKEFSDMKKMILLK